MMNVEKRVEIEQKVVRHLLREMKKAGWQAVAVNDGEEVVRTPLERIAMDVVFSVDESHIRFQKKTSAGDVMTRTAFIVLGNDGWDCICDHAVSNPDIPDDDFEKVMDEAVFPYCERLEMAS